MFFPFFLFFDAKSRPNGGVVGLLNRHAFFFVHIWQFLPSIHF